MAETKKAFERRQKQNFFDKYIKGKVIDIGVGRIDTHDGADPLTEDCDTWDKDNGDATLMQSIQNETYDTVYTSHLLEHISNPTLAIHNWFRILKQGGYLIISVPHRDLYERKKQLPSKWNADHKFFILPEECEPPHTFSLMGLVKQALKGQDYKIVSLNVQNTCTNVNIPEEHGNGEYSIEVIIEKSSIKVDEGSDSNIDTATSGEAPPRKRRTRTTKTK